MDITATVILVLVGSGITLFSAITNLRYKIDEKRDMILGVYKEHQDLEKRFRKYILQKDIGEYAVHAVIIIGMHSFIWIAIAIYLLSLGVNTNDKMNCVMAMIIFVMALSGTVGCIYTALSARQTIKFGKST